MTLKAGMKAPEFEAPDADGKMWKLSALRGTKVVLYFYPADDTPGCTAEACDFRDHHHEFLAAGYTVLGVSPQDSESHRNFADKHGLPFPLLVDTDARIATAYGAYGEQTLYGNKVTGILRSTFVIDAGGNIERALCNVRAKGHVDRLKTDLLG